MSIVRCQLKDASSHVPLKKTLWSTKKHYRALINALDFLRDQFDMEEMKGHGGIRRFTGCFEENKGLLKRIMLTLIYFVSQFSVFYSIYWVRRSCPLWKALGSLLSMAKSRSHDRAYCSILHLGISELLCILRVPGILGKLSFPFSSNLQI